MSQHPLPPKKDVMLALLERSTVRMHLDPRSEGVVVPPWFKKQPQLALDIGLNMVVPIPDLRVDDDGVSCTLSFNRAPFHCVMPWSAIFALVGDDGRGMVWPDDLPPELARPAPSPRPQIVPPPAEESAPAKAPAKASGKKGDGPKRGKRSAEGDAPVAAAPEGPRAVPSPVDTDEAKAKKARKKPRIVPPPPPEARGPLVAVPNPPAPGAPRRPTGHGKSKKRELPPYLRVVK